MLAWWLRFKSNTGRSYGRYECASFRLSRIILLCRLGGLGSCCSSNTTSFWDSGSADLHHLDIIFMDLNFDLLKNLLIWHGSRFSSLNDGNLTLDSIQTLIHINLGLLLLLFQRSLLYFRRGGLRELSRYLLSLTLYVRPKQFELLLLLYGQFVCFKGFDWFFLVIISKIFNSLFSLLFNDGSDFAHAIHDGKVLHLKQGECLTRVRFVRVRIVFLHLGRQDAEEVCDGLHEAWWLVSLHVSVLDFDVAADAGAPFSTILLY